MCFSISRCCIPKLILDRYKEFDRLHVPPPKVLADQSLMEKGSQQPRSQPEMLAFTLEIWLDCRIESLSQHWTELFICNVHLYALNHASCLCVSPGYSSANLQEHCSCWCSCVLKEWITLGCSFSWARPRKSLIRESNGAVGKKQTRPWKVSRRVLQVFPMKE